MQVPGRKTGAEIHHNTKTKLYPDGTQKVTYCSRPIFREPGYEEVNKPLRNPPEKRTYNTEGDSRKDNIRRSVNAVFDIALLNPFDTFLTITIDPKNDLGLDRYDPDACCKVVKKWLNHRVSRWPGFKYLLLPEHHKDGAIHCHALVSGLPSLVDSGTVSVKGCGKPVKLSTALKKGIAPEDCHTVYNLPSWTLGHSTAIRLYGESAKVANYVVKYITKDAAKIFGNFYLAGGHGLVRKPPVKLSDTCFSDIEARTYEVKQARLSFKYQTLRPDESEDSLTD